MPLVFQYGSNTNVAHLNGPTRLQGHATLLGVALTARIHELVFDIWSKGNDCAAADLTAGVGRNIWGVLYDIPALYIERDPARKRPSLDAIEGEGKNYSRVNIELQHCNGEPVQGPVITYLGRDRKDDIQTSSTYVGFILQGLRGHPQIPEEYVQYVRARALANNPNLELV